MIADDISISKLLEALEDDPTNSAGHVNLALLLMEDKKYFRAMLAAKEAVKLDPSNKNAYYVSAKLLYFNHKYEEAIKAAEKYKELDGDENFLEILKGLKDFPIEVDYTVIEITVAGGRGHKNDFEKLVESKGFNPNSLSDVINFMYYNGYSYVDTVKKISTNISSVVGVLFKRQPIPEFLL